MGSMSQQDQSPASLFIKISNQSVGEADLQLAGTEEAMHGPCREAAIPPSVSLLVSALSFHSRALGTGRCFLCFPSMSPCPCRGAAGPACHSGGDGAAFWHDVLLNRIGQCRWVGYQN